MVLNYYYYFLLGAPAVQTIRTCAPHLCWSIIRGCIWVRLMRLAQGRTRSRPGCRWLVQQSFSRTCIFVSRLLLAEPLVHVPLLPLGSSSVAICYDYQGREVGRLGGISTLIMRKAALASGTLLGYPRVLQVGTTVGPSPIFEPCSTFCLLYAEGIT